MTLEERKIELINWIANLNNESLLQRMEELRNDSSKDLPDAIISLLESSVKTPVDQLTEHTSARDILKK